MSCKAYKAYEVVANIWVSIPCIAGTPFRRINEKLGAETGDIGMAYKLVVAAVGLRRSAVQIGDGFSWDWSNGNKLWNLVVVGNLFARCDISSCLGKIVTMRPMLIEVMVPYARISRAPGPCRLQALRWEGLRSTALSGFSSECRDPATTAEVDDSTVLRTPRGSGKFVEILCLFRAA